MNQANEDSGNTDEIVDRTYYKIHWGVFKTFKLSPTEGLLITLIDGLSQNDGSCYMAKKTMAEKLNVSLPTINTARKELIAKGLLMQLDGRKGGVFKTVKLAPTQKYKDFLKSVGGKNNSPKSQKLASKKSGFEEQGSWSPESQKIWADNKKLIEDSKKQLLGEKYNSPQNGKYGFSHILKHGNCSPGEFFIAAYWSFKEKECIGTDNFHFDTPELADRKCNEELENANLLARTISYERLRELMKIVDENDWNEKEGKYSYNWKLSTILRNVNARGEQVTTI